MVRGIGDAPILSVRVVGALQQAHFAFTIKWGALFIAFYSQNRFPIPKKLLGWGRLIYIFFLIFLTSVTIQDTLICKSCFFADLMIQIETRFPYSNLIQVRTSEEFQNKRPGSQ